MYIRFEYVLVRSRGGIWLSHRISTRFVYVLVYKVISINNKEENTLLSFSYLPLISLKNNCNKDTKS